MDYLKNIKFYYLACAVVLLWTTEVDVVHVCEFLGKEQTLVYQIKHRAHLLPEKMLKPDVKSEKTDHMLKYFCGRRIRSILKL